MRPPEFEAYLTEARQRPELWRMLLGIVLILFIYIATAVLVLVVAGGAVAAQEGPFGVIPFLTGLAVPDQPYEVVVMLLTFAGMVLGPILAAAALHYRGPETLFGEFDTWLRGFLVAICVIAVLYGAVLALNFAVDPPLPNLGFDVWLRWLPLALPLLFVQIAAEELLFRGYLQQQLAVRFASRWVWAVLPSVIFAALHWSPEAGGNLPVVLLSAFVFGLIAADLTAVTGSLGAAMGLHFGNNFLGIFVLSMANTITGLSLYVTPDPVGLVGAQTVGMVFSIGVLVLIWWITRRILTRI